MKKNYLQIKDIIEEITFTTRLLNHQFMDDKRSKIKNIAVFERRIKKLGNLSKEILGYLAENEFEKKGGSVEGSNCSSYRKIESEGSNDSSFCEIFDEEKKQEMPSLDGFLQLEVPNAPVEPIQVDMSLSNLNQIRILRLSEPIKGLNSSSQPTIMAKGPAETLLFCNEMITVLQGQKPKFQYKSQLTSKTL